MTGRSTTHGRASADAGGTRGQTNIDFAIGVTVFLLTVAFVFLFAPSLFTPFQPVAGHPIQSDRAATHLVETTFRGDGGNVLATPCVTGFFENRTVAGCPYDPAPLDASLGLRPEAGARVRILTDDGSVATVDGTTLSRGPAPSDDVTATSRSVLVNGRGLRVRVEVW